MKCPKCQSNNPVTSSFCAECGTQLSCSEDLQASPTRTLETPKEMLTRGTVFARRYEIIEELGQGGMGKVYRVEDKKIREELALKLINPEIASDKKTIERFGNELKTARKIAHRNVCKMYELMEDAGTHFITMEYISGQDLKGLIRQSGQLAIGTTISIAKQVCEGLAEAHRLGVVHRDLKPSNIMIDKESNARIMDFGIARSLESKGMTSAGMIVGTPDYMSPEQVEVKEVDQRSDIYSLGLILYEMTTGRRPFVGETALSIVLKHKTEAPPDPRESNAHIPIDLSRLILKCLEKNKTDRYQNAEDLISDLDKLDKIEKGISTGERISVERKPEAEKIEKKKWQNSIAVLPFVDLSPQKDQEYFCDGMAEEIINALTQIKELRVVARTSAFSFKGKDFDIREIGEKLNVENVLEGSVRKAANRLRITAQLVSVADGYHLWSDRFDRELSDVFAIQDEVTLAIVDKLKLELIEKDRARLTKRHTDDQEAYDLYLRGRYFLNLRTGDALKKSIEYFKKAIKQDPSCAPAYSGLADSYSVYSFYGFIPPKQIFPRAKAAVKKALEMDDTLAEAHASFGYINMIYDWDWPAAEIRLKRAIELNPNYASAHHSYACYLSLMGRFDESRSEMKRALELDPLSVRYQTEFGNYCRWSGRLDEALEQLQKALEMDKNFAIAHLHIGLVLALKEKYKEAIAAFKKAIKFSGGSPLVIGELGNVYVQSGERDKAEKILQEAEEMAREKYFPPVSIASIYARLGKIDHAFEWLEKGYEEHDTLMAFLNTWPEFECLRSHAKIKPLLKKLGFE